MPHKHRRDKKADQEQFELPPDSFAAPLPPQKSTDKTQRPQKAAQKHNNSKRKRARKDDDDTPRAFARLMAWKQGIKPRSGLDDGAPKSKKPKHGADDAEDAPVNKPKENALLPVPPKLLPGERMSDYSARVDQALPLAGLITKGKGPNLPGVKRQQTKTERKLQKMQKEWREVDARYKERLREAQEDAEEDEDPYEETLNAVKAKRKKGKVVAGDDDDPWAVIAKARKEQSVGNGGLVGLHDVVQAPPQLKAQKEKFKLKNGAKVQVSDVPGASGSLRRREELGETRQGIIESYRQMMKDKRTVQNV